MNRKPRVDNRTQQATTLISAWHQHLLTRRRFLITAAGGSLTAVFSLPSMAVDNKASVDPAAIDPRPIDPWPIIDSVQQHLFPTEQDAPGAREINALAYLQFVFSDATLDTQSREFITKGASWLEAMAQQMQKHAFTTLNEEQREKVLRRIASSDAGENWLSSLMLYIVEALLTDPVYGGNTDQLGWKWLQHVPGFPRPPRDKTFPRLLS